MPSLLLTNLRSLSNKYDEVSFAMCHWNPDIAVFTETWLDADIPDSSISIPNYEIYRHDRERGRGGGIACYIGSSTTAALICDSDIPSASACESEFLIMFVKDYHLLLVCIYHAFWSDPTANENALARITEIIDYGFVRYGRNLRIVLCGDFNDLRNRFDDISSSTQLTPIVNFSTRGSNCLDQIFVNFHTDQKATFLSPLGRSDHVVIMWKPVPTVQPPVVKRRVRRITRRKSGQFVQAVSEYDWLSLVQEIDDVNEAAEVFLNCLSSLFDFFFPLRTVRIRSNEPKWMNISLKLIIDDRDRAYHNKQWSKYYRLRKEVSDHIRFLKTKFIDVSVSSSPRPLWKSLRSLGRTYKSRSSSKTFSADDFNTSFSSNFRCSDDVVSQTASTSSNVEPLTIYEVLHFMKKVPNKSCGPDGIPPWVFRNCAYFLCPAVTYLFNLSLSKSVVPECFKLANVIPVPKCEKPQNVSEFRPISLLPVLSKIFEKIIVTKFILPVIVHKVNRSQFAYVPRPGAGTTSAVVLTYHKILQFLDTASGGVRFLSCDFSKAFDKLLHSRILSACANFHISPCVIDWISSFLSSRKQRVFVNGETSSWTPVLSGVPQGSILGPVLFCLTIDSLSPVCTNSFFVKYADDLSVLHFVRGPSDDNLQREWDNIVSWSNSVGLPLNRAKCCILDIVTKRNFPLSDVKVSDGVTLRKVSSLTFLGVVFSDDLKWNLHVKKAVTKANKRIFIVRNLRRSGCPPHLILLAYYSFIRSVLLYAFPCVCNAPNYLLSRLLKIEKRVFRIIGCHSPSVSLFEAAHKSCVKMMTSIEKCSDHPLRVMFNPRNVSSTRASSTLQRPFAKTSRFGNSFVKFCS